MTPSPPSFSSLYETIYTEDVPCSFDLIWQKGSRLKDAVQQFVEHLEKLQEFWLVLDEIDNHLWVVETGKPIFATSFRQIYIGNKCDVLLSINSKKPRSLPECRFLGPNSVTDSLRRNWRKNCQSWINGKPFPENLETLLGITLPPPPCVTLKNDELTECGICYVHCLPIVQGLGAKKGIEVDYTCDNQNCKKAFHSLSQRLATIYYDYKAVL